MNQITFTYTLSNALRLRVVHGDITQEAVDAIVNAANGRLAHVGGVAGAIARRGGSLIRKESAAWVRDHGRVPTGQAAITGGGRLAARYVIHAVGPVWKNRGDEESLLASAVRAALDLADAHALQSLSLPAISSGIFGFPKPLAAQAIWGAVLEYLNAHPVSTLQEIRFCNIDAQMLALFEDLARKASAERQVQSGA